MSRDDSIRTLVRALACDGPDALAEWRVRIERWRCGLVERFEWRAGDRLMLREVETPWMRAPGPATIVRMNTIGGADVRPDGPACACGAGDWHRATCAALANYRTTPSPGMLRRGVYVTGADIDASDPLPPVTP